MALCCGSPRKCHNFILRNARVYQQLLERSPLSVLLLGESNSEYLPVTKNMKILREKHMAGDLSRVVFLTGEYLFFLPKELVSFGELFLYCLRLRVHARVLGHFSCD